MRGTCGDYIAMAKQETEAADSNGYVSLIRRMQSECAMETWTGASKLGTKAPTLLEALDVLLSYLVPRHSDFDRLSEGGTNLPMGRGTYPDGLVRIFARIDFKRVEITVQRY
jgi:hypothetical protein